MITETELQLNLSAVYERMQAAAMRAGVPVPRLLAVTKSCEDEAFRSLLSLGVTDVGENRARACEARAAIIKEEKSGARMHFIGTLQANKVKYIVDKIALLHSLDSLSLAKEIDRLAARHGITVPVLVEVNSGRELQKGGILPESLDGFMDALTEYRHLSVRGLMTMAPRLACKEDYRPYFRETRRAFDCLSHRFDTSEPILSMGMSESFEIAIEEGSTLVRVGSALFTEKTI